MPTLKLDRFLAKKHPPTPFIVVDLDVVRSRNNTLRQALPSAEIYAARPTRAANWSAMPAFCSPRSCSFRADRSMNARAGFTPRGPL